MKKSCNGCKALVLGLDGLRCRLRFKIRPFAWMEKEIGMAPLEECSKPMTGEDLAFQADYMERNRRAFLKSHQETGTTISKSGLKEIGGIKKK